MRPSTTKLARDSEIAVHPAATSARLSKRLSSSDSHRPESGKARQGAASGDLS